jgi:hypothetical protein
MGAVGKARGGVSAKLNVARLSVAGSDTAKSKTEQAAGKRGVMGHLRKSAS